MSESEIFSFFRRLKISLFQPGFSRKKIEGEKSSVFNPIHTGATVHQRRARLEEMASIGIAVSADLVSKTHEFQQKLSIYIQI